MSAPTVSKHMTESVETHLTEKLKVASLVAICVPTFKRSEQLEQLLQSVRALDRDSIDVHLIVVDNDVERSANSVVADVMRDSEIPVTYDCVKVPSRPRARNRLVELAGFVGADWIWFLDDDQVVMPDALRHLLSTANTYDADGVVGRVPQIFEATHRPWAQWSGLFNEVHRPMGMPTRNFGCGGILLRRTAIDRVPHPFDDRLLPEFPEDSVFLARFREKGSRIVGCDEAVILDHVSASRNNPHWILMRALRLGQANGFSVREFSPSMWNSVKWLVLGGGYGIENLLLALVTMALGPSKSFRFWVRTVRGLGIMIGVLSPSRILQHRVSSVCLSW